jgi:hypothetical protein
MENKCIGRFATKTKTTSGEICKTICWVHSNGIVFINQLILSDKKRISQYKKLYSKFGKTLFVKAIGFKYPTLNTIHNQTTKILVDAKIKPDDLCM